MSTGPDLGLSLKVVTGRPTVEEVAALTAVVQALAAARARAEPTPGAGPGAGSTARRAWPIRAALVRAPLTPGPGAWRRSALPH